MSKIGILGGAFNPVHNAHLAIASSALRIFNLDTVIFMPSGNPPHKDFKDFAPAADRLEMLRLAVAGNPKFSVSDFEIKNESVSYTADTLLEMKKLYPSDDLYFIVGGDSVMAFDKWSRPKEILRLATVLACGRRGIGRDMILSKIESLKMQFNGDIRYFETDDYDISSADIRKKLSEGTEYSYFEKKVPAYTLKYIYESKLYGVNKNVEYMYSLEELSEMLSKKLKPKRFLHCQSVAFTAASIAMANGEKDISKFLYAGLLHDCAKYMWDKEFTDYCRENHIRFSEDEEKLPFLLHGKVGAHLAKNVYGISDSEILRAIENHTEGRPEMSFLELAIYLADHMEPLRDFETEPPMCDIRALCYKNPEKAAYYLMKNITKFLVSKERFVTPASIETYEYYRKKVGCSND